MARPIEFDPDQALNQAMELFWSKGYDGTSLSELLRVMDLSKSSFYQSFGNKKQLYHRCLHQYRTSISKQLQKDLKRAPRAIGFLADLFTSIARDAHHKEGRRGCMIMNSASAKAPHDPEIGNIVKQGARQFEDIFNKAVIRAQEEGDIDPGKDPRKLARYLVSSRSGLLAMAKSGTPVEELNEIISVILSSLD